MTEEMPPGRGFFGAGSPQRGWWDQQRMAHWRAAVTANMMFRTPPPPPYYHDLLSLASMLLADGRYELRTELAVVLAQMACEVLVEQTITPRIKVDPQQTFNVHNKNTRKLYKSATADDIENTPFWTQYGAHAIRRHEVVHRSRRVSPAEAQESLTVAKQFVEHVEKVRASLP